LEENKIILGIDPGTNVLGFGLISVQGKKMELMEMGILRMEKITDTYEKLNRIYEKVSFLSEAYKATELAIEAPFFGKNVQSMLKLGRAQGVAIAAGLSHGLNITEYSPREIKQAITGNGNASKEQVAGMLFTLLKFNESSKFLDATDALGVAVCHFFRMNSPITKSSKGWDSFIKNNPNRVLGK
jgi:crossover junction endodeoxyribonuclease RuvC